MEPPSGFGRPSRAASWLPASAVLLFVWGACTADRSRPAPFSGEPTVVPDITILAPGTSQTIPTPGPMEVRVRAQKTEGQWETLAVEAVRFTDRQLLARADTGFVPRIGDTVVVVTLQFTQGLPDNTQLDLTAVAGVAGHAFRSGTISVIAVDCSQPRPFCP